MTKEQARVRDEIATVLKVTSQRFHDISMRAMAYGDVEPPTEDEFNDAVANQILAIKGILVLAEDQSLPPRYVTDSTSLKHWVRKAGFRKVV